MGRWVSSAAVLALAATSCSLFTDLGGLTPDPVEAGVDATTDAAKTDAGAGDGGPLTDGGRCSFTRGPSMVNLKPEPGKDYCIDSTEVTQAQYEAFLATNPSTSGQGAFCAANGSYAPDQTQPGCATQPFDPGAHPNYPVSCVDFCDAVAFCKWAGKRLCGRIGADAGPANYLGASALSDQWYVACSADGVRAYPYGNAYDAGACKGVEKPGDAGRVNVGSLATCEGGYPKLFDMSGNVGEWGDACDVDAGKCLVRGGGFTELASQLACSGVDGIPRLTPGVSFGFRCCAD